MSKKLTKIMSVILALVMMCSLLPMSALAAENDTYTVTFAPGNLCVYNGEGAYPTSTYDGTGEFLLPDPATLYLDGRLDNFVFQGWALEGGDGKLYSIGDDVADLITGDVTFLANYAEPVNPGTVTYTISPGTIENDTYNQARTNGPIPEQYVDEISLPTTDEGIMNEFSWVIPSDLTFSHWENQNKEAIPEEAEIDRTVSFLPKDGDVYTAIWESATATTYTVTLNPGTADGQTVPGTPVVVEVQAGTEYYGPSTDPFVYEGYLIVGWSETDGGERVSFPITVNRDIELYAVWEKQDVTEYWDVTFLPGEGASFRDTVSGYKDGAIVTQAVRGQEYNIAMLNANETAENEEQEYYNVLFLTMPEGMEFAGWSDGTHTYYSGQVATITEDTTFTALWRETGKGPYKLIFNAGTLSQYSKDDDTYGYNRDYAIDVAAGASYTLPTTIPESFGWTIPTGYEFDGWFELGYQNEKITSVNDMSGDVTVVAIWVDKTPDRWTVRFDANGGEGTMNPVTVTTDAATYSYYLPSNDFTAPAGMEFAYWTVSGFDGEYQPGDLVVINSDITVTAHWKPIRYYYMVSFDAGDGSGFMPPVMVESTTPEATYIAPECTLTPPTEGMTFLYWVADNGNFYFPGMPITLTGDITLTATWVGGTSANFMNG